MATVYFDAGHTRNTFDRGGGKGVRRNGRSYEEHDSNIDIAEHAEKILKSHGFDVHITSQSYASSESLTSRTNEANRANADLLVSIHANAGASSANGACIFHWPTSEDFANIWANQWEDADTGVGLHGNGKHAVRVGTWTNLHMVREAAMPAYLIEHGFMTNDHDFDYFLVVKKTVTANNVLR